METITYTQVQEVVKRLPTKKLPIAYSLLVDLANKEVDMLSPQLDFMLLPLSDRRRIMAQQAEKMVDYYEQTSDERQDLQAGEFIDEY